MKREPFEKRLLRIFAEAGYPPSRLLDISPEEMVEIPGVTVPNIRAVLEIQKQSRIEGQLRETLKDMLDCAGQELEYQMSRKMRASENPPKKLDKERDSR